MAQALVTKAIQENLVMVFSKSYCPHCVRAKRILDAELGASKYVVLELENRSDCSAIQDYLRQLTGGRTVPRVFLSGNCVARFANPCYAFYSFALHLFQENVSEVELKQLSCKKVASSNNGLYKLGHCEDRQKSPRVAC